MANAKKRLRKAKSYRAKLARQRSMRDYIETPERYLRRVRYTQSKPFITPLPYSFYDVKLLTGDPIRTTQVPSIAGRAFAADGISNKALSKVYAELGQLESLRVAWAERQKSIDLVTSGIRTLISIARAVKRRDPRIVRAVLKRNPTAADIIKTPSGLWLSYHFGIVPTISDIHHAVGLFAEPIPPFKAEGTSSGTVRIDDRPGITNQWREGFDFDVTKIVKMGVDVTGINTNVALATSLGFGQPLSVAWELMTMSWMIDYVVNVGEVIKNLEPRFPGMTLSNAYTTVLLKGTAARGYRKSYLKPWVADQTWSYVAMQRTLSLPKYALVFKSPFDLKGQQASYVIAVLLPMLVGMKK